MTPRLSVRHLTKAFGRLVALDDVSFDLQPGEVRCLLGENGAGKTTLSRCLAGLLRPDAGEILVDGIRLDLHSPSRALAAGIGMVHQHFVLVPAFTVLENILVGTRFGWRLTSKEARDKVEGLCRRHDLELELDRRVGDLAVGQQQWVEILKALFLDSRLLLLDEPTASLTPQESAKLFAMVRRMAADGMTVIFISHKMNEVMQSDSVTVLRKGRLIDSLPIGKTSRAHLTRLAIGKDIEAVLPAQREQSKKAVVLALEHVSLRNEQGRLALDDVSLNVHEGEIFGIAGVAGNGQTELMETISGLRQPHQGQIALDGRPLRALSPRQIADLGLGHVPNDRLRDGLVPDMAIADNLILGQQWEPPFRQGPWLDHRRIHDHAEQAMISFGIAAPGPDTRIARLSGGNAQKVILAREFAKGRRCLLCHQPTRGLDVGMIDAIHGRLEQLRQEGVAILLVSEELEELLALADRIAVMSGGRILSIMARANARIETIGQLMAGVQDVGS